MTPSRLTVQVYQMLLDRGWRRSGMWLYTPLNDQTCCICYTHRLDVTKFTASKAQRRALRKFNNYISAADAQLAGQSPTRKPCAPRKQREQDPSGQDQALAELISTAIQDCLRRGLLPQGMARQTPRVQRPTKQHLLDAGVLHTSAAAFAVSAAAKKASGSTATPQQVAELLAAAIGERGSLLKAEAGHLNFYDSQPRAVEGQKARPPPVAESAERKVAAEDMVTAVPNESSRRQRMDCDVDSRAERVASSQKASSSGQGDRENAHQTGNGRAHRGLKWEITMIRSSSALLPVEFPLYFKYQTRHHKEPAQKVTAKSFKRFLIDTPLVPVPAESCASGSCPPCGFGSFHQQYWLDGTLVAVGVVDILPGCLSSKYFFWDPDLAHLSLGKLGALLEIEWVKSAHLHCPSLQYYYMGYYIHTCPKMRYKVEFEPADLMCPRTLRWVPFSSVKAALDARPCTQLVPGPCEDHLPPEALAAEANSLRVRLPLAKPVTVTFGFLKGSGILPESMMRETVPVLEGLVEHVGPVARELLVVL